MRNMKLLLAASAALCLTVLACQAADQAPAQDAPAAHERMKGHDMTAGHHSADRDGKSHRCMHKGGMMGEARMPHMVPLPSLPAGNAKLQLQMQAEIMQQVGEILAKYAAQVKEAPTTP